MAVSSAIVSHPGAPYSNILCNVITRMNRVMTVILIERDRITQMINISINLTGLYSDLCSRIINFSSYFEEKPVRFYC